MATNWPMTHTPKFSSSQTRGIQCHMPHKATMRATSGSSLYMRNKNHFPGFLLLSYWAGQLSQRQCSPQHPLQAPSFDSVEIQLSQPCLYLLHILLGWAPVTNLSSLDHDLMCLHEFPKGAKSQWKGFHHPSTLITFMFDILQNPHDLYHMKKSTLII